MPRFAQLVIGPAGSGKSTYCNAIYQHCQSVGRVVHIVNLDPAAEEFHYPVSVDIRELVSLQDVMEELNLGPNGGLVYCMDFLVENLDDWLKEQLDDFIDDDYVIFDCPGQIELYSHIPVLRIFVDQLRAWDFALCAVYVLDSQFMSDVSKFIAGSMACLAAMVKLELPHVSILSKMDKVDKKATIDMFLTPDTGLLLEHMHKEMGPRYSKLNQAIASLLEDYNMVSFLPFDISSEDSIAYVLSHIDNAIQFGEDADVNTSKLDRQLEAENELDMSSYD
eukprot:jgi/Mesvir1/15270/Mv06488-RA.1